MMESGMVYLPGEFRLFGGDAARQRAELFASENGGRVAALGTRDTPFKNYGLDPYGRLGDVVYSYVVEID